MFNFQNNGYVGIQCLCLLNGKSIKKIYYKNRIQKLYPKIVYWDLSDHFSRIVLRISFMISKLFFSFFFFLFF
jgi:hypothetical protein